MLTAYVPQGNTLEPVPLAPSEDWPERAVWVDALAATPEELAQLARALPIDLPTREEVQEIEASSRLYTEGEALVMATPVLHRSGSEAPESSIVTFILLPNRLVTLRDVDPQPFALFARKMIRVDSAESPDFVMVRLLEAVCDRLADILEQATIDLDSLSREIFRKERDQATDLREALRRLGHVGDLATRARESLLGLSRLLLFYATKPGMAKDLRLRIKTIQRDAASITDHAGFLAGKVNFLLDATLGMINIEQNSIIKIFTVAAVAFLPPTLVASIYGMNFEVFPELKWELGYPFALVLMLLSAAVPFWYFRRKGWL